MAPDQNACLSTSAPKKADYFLLACYILIYLELAWLTFVLVRTLQS